MTELEQRLATAFDALSQQYNADITNLSQQITALSQQLLGLQQQVTNSALQTAALTDTYRKLEAAWTEEFK